MGHGFVDRERRQLGRRPLSRGARLACALALVFGCGGGTPYPDAPPDTVGGARPAPVYRPIDYDPSNAYPLLLLLHGYGANGFIQDIYFGASARADARQMIVVVPDGTLDGSGKLYWNAGPCCEFGTPAPDDVAYLTALLDEVEATHHVDRRRVYVVGHSNGGAMAMRLACSVPERLTAFVSLAGIAASDPTDCPPSSHRVSALLVHGTADDVVLYDGVSNPMGIPLSDYPSAPAAADRFASRLGCDVSMTTTATPLDLSDALAGDETTPTVYGPGCAAGTSAQLWTMTGGGHIPGFNEAGKDHLYDWLLARAR